MTSNSRIKNGFGLVSNTVLRDPELSIREKGVYSYLATYADSHDNSLTVSVNRIASECGITQSTVKRILESLVNKKVITREKRMSMQSYKTVLLK